MRRTIGLYKELQVADKSEDTEEDDSLSETDMSSWMYNEPPSEFNCNLVLSSSPPEHAVSP